MKHLEEFEKWNSTLQEGFPYSTFAELGRRGYNKSRERYGSPVGSGDKAGDKAGDSDLYKKLLQMVDKLKQEEAEIVVKAISPGGEGEKKLEVLEIKPYKNFLYHLGKRTLDLNDLDFLYANVQAPKSQKNSTGESRVNQLRDEIMGFMSHSIPFKVAAEKLKSKVPVYGKSREEILNLLEGPSKGGNWFKNLFK
jgi:hypothetical protein